jgi:IclR family acetate operon transcriptional repressor
LSITSKQQLREELAQVRTQGYALNRGEHLPGVGAIGAPVFDRYGTAVASISVAFPLYMVPDSQWPSVAEAVVDVAQQISRRLGTQSAGPGHATPGTRP